MAVIGIFDSGVGGLSVLAAVRAALPASDLLYVADTAHVPYGPRPLAQVREFAFGITGFLHQAGAEVVVVACNTASAAALHELRAAWPQHPFVGMEPAVKPAAEHSHTGVVGVLATPATFQGALFASVVERFAQGVEVIPQVCLGLVEQIEAGELNTPRTEAMLRSWVEPLLARNIDALVLGCTHYPFVRPLLEQICGPGVRVIDPSAAVARQVARVVEKQAESTPNLTPKFTPQGSEAGSGAAEHEAVCGARITYYTSGPAGRFEQLRARLGSPSGEITAVKWSPGEPPTTTVLLPA
jgi:glutamate racemase